MNAQSAGASVNFAPQREYPGPVVLEQNLVLDGCGATLWALMGPVLTVKAAVCLQNLRIEITGDASTLDVVACAILVAPGGHLTLKNVEVRGLVCGLPQEEGVWHYPHSLALGGITPNMAHDWRFILYVPVDCQIESHISGLKITPNELRIGINDLQIHVDSLPRDFLLDGHLTLSTPVLRRRITVTAYADESSAALRGQGQTIWTPPVKLSPLAAQANASSTSVPSEPIATTSTLPESSTGTLSVPKASPVSKAKPTPRPRDKVPRLRRDQMPNGLFTPASDTPKPVVPEGLDPPISKIVLSELFLDNPQSQNLDVQPVLIDASPAPIQPEEDGISTQDIWTNQAMTSHRPIGTRTSQSSTAIPGLFGGKDDTHSQTSPETSPQPGAASTVSDWTEDDSLASKKRRHTTSLPVDFGEAFKTRDP
ncbi:MAG: hypothetical protein IAF00_06065 [Phycisphaerales bacterium]|nr:hypothetical protein [Phycisphaerales bacterium]